MELDFEKEIQNITQQIIEKYKPKNIVLFGSAARGKPDLDSDVDLLIIRRKLTSIGDTESVIPSQTGFRRQYKSLNMTE